MGRVRVRVGFGVGVRVRVTVRVGVRVRVGVGVGYCHTALPGSRGFSTKHPDGCRGCTFMPDVFARAHRPHRTDHTCIWGSAWGLASGGDGGVCALDMWLLQNCGLAHVPVRATIVGL